MNDKVKLMCDAILKFEAELLQLEHARGMLMNDVFTQADSKDWAEAIRYMDAQRKNRER